MRENILEIKPEKDHWSYADNFGTGEREYIKSFVHRDYEIGMHTHAFYELNIVLGGTGRHYIDKMSCEARAGCVFVIPPNVRHGYSDGASLDVYHMLIHGDFFDACFSEFKGTAEFSMLFEVEPYLRGNYRDNLFLVLTSEELASVNADAAAIDGCRGVANSEDYVNAAAKKLLSSLCLASARRNGVENLQATRGGELGAIAQALRYVHLSYGERITVDGLAALVNMSRSTFIRHFERMCGCPPHAYVSRYRLAKAREKIKKGEKSLTDIAQECGFYDLSHMLKSLDAD